MRRESWRLKQSPELAGNILRLSGERRADGHSSVCLTQQHLYDRILRRTAVARIESQFPFLHRQHVSEEDGSDVLFSDKGDSLASKVVDDLEGRVLAHKDDCLDGRTAPDQRDKALQLMGHNDLEGVCEDEIGGLR